MKSNASELLLNDKISATSTSITEEGNGNDSNTRTSSSNQLYISRHVVSTDVNMNTDMNKSEEESWSDEDDENDETTLLGIKTTSLDRLESNNNGHINVNVNVNAGYGDDERTSEYPETGSTNRTSANTTDGGCGGIRGRIQRWIEKYPYMAQLWTFFFNRSSGANGANATYAPSGPAVFGAALDLSMPVLFNFHIFIEAFNRHITLQGPNYSGSELPVKILPIAFLAVLYARTVIPLSRRSRFWGTMKFTFSAPFHRVNVRDEFIGDCLTSWVRPGQDLLFATIYFFIVIWGTVTGRYGLTKSGDILAESWWIHNVILPHFAILPLWLKYLQTLRQAYDANQRWPYLGNAFKYLSAALVIIYGTTHPDQRKSSTWIACFIFTLFYQIFWDVVMDWQLFEIQRDISVVMAGTRTTTCIHTATTSELSSSSTISRSSFRPDSRILLSSQMYVIQPIKDRYQRLRAQIPVWRNIQLRQQRLYKK